MVISLLISSARTSACANFCPIRRLRGVSRLYRTLRARIEIMIIEINSNNLWSCRKKKQRNSQPAIQSIITNRVKLKSTHRRVPACNSSSHRQFWMYRSKAATVKLISRFTIRLSRLWRRRKGSIRRGRRRFRGAKTIHVWDLRNTKVWDEKWASGAPRSSTQSLLITYQ